MSLTVQQLLADAKRLSGRLREHDQSADQLISRAQEVLKEVDAMKQYQEDVENLNEVAHNRPRAQLVLGIQQENRHIRALQQENKELRAALEEHQNALELIMSKYRQHVTRLINSTRLDKNIINIQNSKLLQQRTEQVSEMAAVMKESVKLDEETSSQQQELLSKLIIENKGLRELLDISRKNGSSPRLKGIPKPSQNKEVQTETDPEPVTVVTLPCPVPSRPAPAPYTRPAHHSPQECSPEPGDNESHMAGREHSSASESDETSDDDSVKFDTIKLNSRRKTVVATVQPVVEEPRGKNEASEPKEIEVVATPAESHVEERLEDVVVKEETLEETVATQNLKDESNEKLIAGDNNKDQGCSGGTTEKPPEEVEATKEPTTTVTSDVQQNCGKDITEGVTGDKQDFMKESIHQDEAVTDS